MAEAGAAARGFELPNPQLTAAQAEAVVRAHWGLEVRAEPIGSTQDQNFRVVADDGTSSVLKVASPLWSRAELELQDAAMRHLAARGVGVAVPEPRPALDGSDIVTDQGHLVRLLTWVDGLPLWEVGRLGAEGWRALGGLAARTTRGLADFEHPELDRVLQWDSRRATEVVEALARDEPEETRARLAAVLARRGAPGGRGAPSAASSPSTAT